MRWTDIKALALSHRRPRGLTFSTVSYRGCRFVVLENEDVGWRLRVRGEYEEQEIDALAAFIDASSRCVDVGANIGIYSVLMAKMAPEGETLAFEPVALNRIALSLNLEINGAKNVKVYEGVLSERAGDVVFSVSVDGAYSSIVATGNRPEKEAQTVRSFTLDGVWLESPARIDVMKVDVEGAELLALKGGARLLRERELRPRAVLVELNACTQAAYGYGPGDVVSYMAGFGYRVYSLVDGKNVAGWPAAGGSENALFVAG